MRNLVPCNGLDVVGVLVAARREIDLTDTNLSG